MKQKHPKAKAIAGQSSPQQKMFDEAIRHHQSGHLAEAEALYQEILAKNAHHADALHLLGVIAHQVGGHEAAVDLIQKAIDINPMAAAYHSNLGNALNELGRRTEALAAFESAIRILPSFANGHYNRGNTLQELGRPVEALAAYELAICLQPDFALPYLNRGNMLKDLNRLPEAVTAFKTATTRDDTLASYDTALKIRPDCVEAHSNRGNILKDLDRPEEALTSYDTALSLSPDYAQAHYNRGIALHDLGRLDAALSAYGTAIKVRPDYAEALYNLSLCHLLRGDFPQGWDKYEWRWRGASTALKPRGFTQPRWQGEGFAGKTMLLHAEQGFGDTIQFCRYAPLVAERGGQVVLEAPRSLIRLLSGLKGVDRLVAAGDPLPDFDLHCPLMSLPGVFGTTGDSIPADIPYLSAEPERVERWRRHVGSQGLKIGVVWQGNPAAPEEKDRSAPLAAFASLARLPGARLISLQKTHGLDQLSALPPDMRVETLGADFDAGPDAFLDTAAVMMSLDLIVTADTSVAHLAGSLGRPIWIALSCLPEWRWMLKRDDSPWYPSVRLFRQTERGDWQGLFAGMAARLAARLGDRLADSPKLSG